MSLLKYRKDIDGFRAIAVLSVIVAHAFPRLHFNGFIGVDIFLVISGYLITGILAREIEQHTFSVSNFYIRRIKRILPVFYVVILTTLIAGMLLMLPEDIKSLAKSAFSATLSSSNIYFWYSQDTGYFAQSSELIPLLHTWSLGVEEQFYMVWPFVMLFAYKCFGVKSKLFVALLVGGASYVFSEYILGIDPEFAYYMLPARAGELLTGAAAFLCVHRFSQPLKADWQYEFISAAGVVLLAYGLFSPSVGASFPGFNSIYPCLGAALIILTGAYRQTLASRALSWSPLVYIGLISYSLYLWHWPVLAYLRYLYTTLSVPMVVGAMITTAILSILTFNYVEMPFRKNKVTARTVYVGYLIIPSALLVALTFGLYKSDGLHQMISDDPSYQEALVAHEKVATPAYAFPYVCQSTHFDEKAYVDQRCVIGDASQDVSTLLWGDSHAAHYVGFIDEVAKASGVAVRNLVIERCPPVFLEVPGYGSAVNMNSCQQYRKFVRQYIGAYRSVVIGARWEHHDQNTDFWSQFRETITEIAAQDIDVVILAQTPIFPNFSRNCVLRNQRFWDVDCLTNTSYGAREDTDINQKLMALAAANDRINIWSPFELICAGGHCRAYDQYESLYFDQVHLNLYGSRKLGRAYLKSTVPLPEFWRAPL